jgi:HK97 family phage major capsid protein
MATAGLQEVNTAGLSVPDAFHRGMTAVRLSLEDEPTAFLVHPTTYQNFVLAKGTDGHYLNLQGPQMMTPPNIWGKPCVISTVISPTSALVGNWQMGSTLWVRSGIQVAATDSDGDDFRAGIITILAELRAAER